MRGGVLAAFRVEAVEVERVPARTSEVRAQRRNGSDLVAAGQSIENHRVLAQRDGNARGGDADAFGDAAEITTSETNEGVHPSLSPATRI